MYVAAKQTATGNWLGHFHWLRHSANYKHLQITNNSGNIYWCVLHPHKHADLFAINTLKDWLLQTHKQILIVTCYTNAVMLPNNTNWPKKSAENRLSRIRVDGWPWCQELRQPIKHSLVEISTQTKKHQPNVNQLFFTKSYLSEQVILCLFRFSVVVIFIPMFITLNQMINSPYERTIPAYWLHKLYSISSLPFMKNQ